MAASKGTFLKKVIAFICIAALSIELVAVGLLLKSETLQEIEYRTWDFRARSLAKQGTPDPRIVLLDIDQHALITQADDGAGNLWPWPRELYVPAIHYLAKGGAKALLFDILFTEASKDGLNQDLALADAMKQLPVIQSAVLSASELPVAADQLNSLREFFKNKKFLNKARNDYIDRYIPPAKGISLPVPALLEAAAHIGNASAAPDSDGIFRHYLPGQAYKGSLIPNAAFALYDLHEKNTEIDLKDFTDEQHRLTLRYQGIGRSYQRISFQDLLESFLFEFEGEEKPHNYIPSEFFKDKYVLLGVSAPGLLDLRPTPVNERGMGAEIVATVLDNLLNENFVRKFTFWQNMFFATVFIVLFCLAILFSPYYPFFQCILVLGIMALQFLATYVMALQGVWIALFAPLIGSLSVCLLGTFWLYSSEGRQRSFIKKAFSHYVVGSVVDQLLDDPSRLNLGGERRELTIFFSDIQGFTSLSEAMTPEMLVALLNEYLTELTDLILESGGTLDKYEGDAIIAFWNAPLDVEDHARAGALTALACQSKLEELRDHFQEKYNIFPFTRIGVNTGMVTVGNFGSQKRFDYTMIGDAANFAARLEGVNKVFGTRILVSEANRTAVGDACFFRRIAKVLVVGKQEALTIYEPFEEKPVFSEHWESALEAFETGNILRARELFSELVDDPVAKAYLVRIEEEGLIEQLPESWSAVWELKSK